ncbi:prostaglandin reductase-3-like isoform X1 [Ruditapes philippinarum]|uniref:prostaglandin reductase-3-like isoform X1 n=1 Tax=Ruditapes philippinarum TaxID=129788 RepID=UPI00295B914C|nr:prostaglandin reductase-3-like isoform X1 [Ruditapes philippinarum]
MASKKLPSTIRKLVATRASSNFREVVSIVTQPTPKPGDGEVLVKNRFVGINASDINFTAGRYDPTAKYPIDIGFEAVAEVVDAGPNAMYKPGQPVMYLQYGAFSDYKIVKASVCVPLPEVKAEYLPFILSGNTAAISLDKVGELKSGETVLVTAAAGGTGQIAVQWAKLKGCHVIGTCSSEDKIQFLKSIGCDRPVNYKTENLREVLKKEYPKGLDVVYETIGGDMFDTCVENLATHGRLIIIGYIENYETDKGYKPSHTVSTLPARLLRISASVRGFFLMNFAKDTAPYVMQQIQYHKEGKLKSFVDMGEKASAGPFVGLEKIVDAVEHLYSKKSIGKIVVDVSSKL